MKRLLPSFVSVLILAGCGVSNQASIDSSVKSSTKPEIVQVQCENIVTSPIFADRTEYHVKTFGLNGDMYLSEDFILIHDSNDILIKNSEADETRNTIDIVWDSKSQKCKFMLKEVGDEYYEVITAVTEAGFSTEIKVFNFTKTYTISN